MSEAASPEDVLTFWFGELTDGFADAAQRKLWFGGDAAFDNACREGFGAVQAQAEAGGLGRWLDSPRSSLAYILLCDQFPRNLYRNAPRAFASDALARRAARKGIRRGFDLGLGYDERAFYYLPFEHSEDLLDQHTSVGLFTDLRDSTPSGRRELTGAYLRHAQQHRDVIRRYGRFPHRNAALGRETSPAEADFLAERGRRP